MDKKEIFSEEVVQAILKRKEKVNKPVWIVSKIMKAYEMSEYASIAEFVGKDICSAFGDTNYRRSLLKIDDDEKGVSQIDTPGGKQNMIIVNESGLYSLLFTMEPQKANMDITLVEERVKKRNNSNVKIL